MVRLLLLFATTLSLVNCSALKPRAAAPPHSLSTSAPGSTLPVVRTRRNAPRLASAEPSEVRQPRVRRVTFRVDSRRSSGLIATVLDPLRLGPRKSSCRCPLRGSITGDLVTLPDGSRSLTLQSVDLATTTDGHLRYSWSPLIGSIENTIPAGALTIAENSFSGPLAVGRNGQFARPGNKFAVGGVMKVEGRGLLLKNKVGRIEKNITIKETEPVTLSGTLRRHDGQWVLRLPSAVLKDRFEIDADDTILDLHFTADITAVAQ